jgi:hypothetical protein
MTALGKDTENLPNAGGVRGRSEPKRAADLPSGPGNILPLPRGGGGKSLPWTKPVIRMLDVSATRAGAVPYNLENAYEQILS